MFSFIWHTIFFDPVYNGLVFFIDIVPGGDVGIAIVLLTVLVKLLLLPLSVKALRTQRAMQALEPALAALKEKHKDNREAQAKEMMALYKDAGVNPFASIFLFFIQIPFIIALYLSVYSGGGVRLPEINLAILYSFLPPPETANMLFLGFLDIAAKSLPLAVLAGVTQYFQAHLSLPKAAPADPAKPASFKDDFARSMQLQMRYVMPFIIFFVAYTISAAVALYFTVSNLVSIVQELLTKKNKIETPTA